MPLVQIAQRRAGLFRLTGAALVTSVLLLPVPRLAAQEPEPQIEPTVQKDIEPTVQENIEPTVVGYDEYNDPFEPWNRAIFGLNDFTYRYAMIPLGRAWMNGVPEPVRTGVSGMFSNIREPLNAANHLLQGKPAPAGSAVFRFAINSTVGLLGFFDPAEAWFGVQKQKSTLDDTLGGYGFYNGPYFVMPFLGASDIRGGVSRVAEGMANPIRYVMDDPESTYTRIFGGFQEFAPFGETYLKLREQAEDPYIYFRNQYLQGVKRDREYRDEQ